MLAIAAWSLPDVTGLAASGWNCVDRHDSQPRQMWRPVQGYFFRLNGWNRLKLMRTLPLAVILVLWFETGPPIEYENGH
jgi:hypothetical protein